MNPADLIARREALAAHPAVKRVEVIGGQTLILGDRIGQGDALSCKAQADGVNNVRVVEAQARDQAGGNGGGRGSHSRWCPFDDGVVSGS